MARYGLQGARVVTADISARAEITACLPSARTQPDPHISINSFFYKQLAIAKVSGTLVASLPLTSVGEVNHNHVPSYY
jgi:hypothetical protein